MGSSSAKTPSPSTTPGIRTWARGCAPGDIPAWNPYQFSGAPFAADPLSGWTYLPAMILFTILPLAAAAGSYLFVHLLLAGLFTYALARALRMNVAGALLAAVAYEFNGFMYWRNVCCSPYASVMTWLPLAVLGAELAIRSSRWLDRGLWWGVGGLALSQVLAAWPGQGSYYALLALGGYVAYRTLLFPPREHPRYPGPGSRASTARWRRAAVRVRPRRRRACSPGSSTRPCRAWQTATEYRRGQGGLGRMDIGGLEEAAGPRPVYPGLATLALALVAPLLARGRLRHALLRRARTLHPHPGGSGRNAAAFGTVPSVTRFRMDTPARPRTDKGDPVPRVCPPRRRHVEPPGRAGQRGQGFWSRFPF